MVARGNRHRVKPVMVVILVLAEVTAPSTIYGQSPQETSRKWRVVVTDPLLGRQTRRALDTAAAWLESPSCAGVLNDFSDPQGHVLADRLLAVDAATDVVTYLELVLFVDDTRNAACRGEVVAISVPGTRVVRLCGDAFKRIWLQDSTYAVAALIHEMLHTLGLGENPPSSSEITRRVLTRCRTAQQRAHQEP
jgi:hypothetical protein